MRLNILLSWVMVCLFTLPAYAVSENTSGISLGANTGLGMNALDDLVLYKPGRISQEFELADAGFFSLGFRIAPQINISYLWCYSLFFDRRSYQVPEAFLSGLDLLWGIGVSLDYTLFELENSRILAGASLITYSNDSLWGIGHLFNDFAPQFIAFSPTLSYEYFFGSHFSLGGGFSLPISFFQQKQPLYGFGDGEQVETHSSFAFATVFQPFLYTKYYF